MVRARRAQLERFTRREDFLQRANDSAPHQDLLRGGFDIKGIARTRAWFGARVAFFGRLYGPTDFLARAGRMFERAASGFTADPRFGRLQNTWRFAGLLKINGPGMPVIFEVDPDPLNLHPLKSIRWRHLDRFPYRIIYEVLEQDETVVVAAVLHAARDERVLEAQVHEGSPVTH